MRNNFSQLTTVVLGKMFLKRRDFIAFVKGMNVEPVFFLYEFSLFTFSMIVQNLNLQKICFPENHPEATTICKNSDSVTKAADINTVRTQLRDGLPFIVLIFAGAWRDSSGQSKPLVTLALIGEILAGIIVLIGYYAWSSSAWIIGIVECTLAGLSGGRPLTTMAYNCYVADNTSMEQRTLKLIYLGISILAGATFASAGSGYMISFIGYQYSIMIVISLYAVCLLLNIILIKENTEPNTMVSGKMNFGKFKIALSYRKNNFFVWAMVISSCLVAATISGESTIGIYYMEEGFKYSVTKAGVITSYRVLVSVIATLVLSPLLTKVLKLKDISVCLICLIIATIATILLGIAKTRLELLIFSVFDCTKVMTLSVLKSLMSKHLQKDEIGIFFSITVIGESLIPMAILPFYDLVFHSTESTYIGAFYFISSGVNVLTFGLICLAYFFSDKDEECISKEGDENNNAYTKKVLDIETAPCKSDIKMKQNNQGMEISIN